MMGLEVRRGFERFPADLAAGRVWATGVLDHHVLLEFGGGTERGTAELATRGEVSFHAASTPLDHLISTGLYSLITVSLIVI